MPLTEKDKQTLLNSGVSNQAVNLLRDRYNEAMTEMGGCDLFDIIFSIEQFGRDLEFAKSPFLDGSNPKAIQAIEKIRIKLSSELANALGKNCDCRDAGLPIEGESRGKYGRQFSGEKR